MQKRFTIISIACCIGSMPAFSQNEPKNSTQTNASCTETQALINTDLFGVWLLEWQSGTSGVSAASTTRLTLERNPEFAESLAGHYLRDGIRHEVFGDIEAGMLDLEESNNGKDIMAIWRGRVIEGSCGKAILGTRRLVNAQGISQTEQSYILRRPGW